MGHLFSFEVIYSSRKTLAVQVAADGSVRVRAPRGMSRSSIDGFLHEKEAWIMKHVERARLDFSNMERERVLSESERKRYIKLARDIFMQKTAFYASIMKVSYGRISIREQKTRWGSCSGAGNLNFNWRLIFAPEEVLNYVVVHELAHRREMNHSKAFYTLVEAVLPDYRSSRKWLRVNGSSLWTAV